MARLDSGGETRVLDLDEVPDLHAVGKYRFVTQMRERADRDVVAHAAVQDDAFANRDAIAETRIRKPRVRADDALLARLRETPNGTVRIDDGVATDRQFGLQIRRVRIDDGDAVAHILRAQAFVHFLASRRELDPVVDAKNVKMIAGHHGDDAFAAAHEIRDGVRQIILALRVVVA